jgi:hypothetical protein
MKQSILSNWNFFRFFRLGIGIAIFVQAVMARDILLGIAGLLFTGMAIFNMGCCGMGGCSTPVINQKKSSGTKKDISYEELV